MIVQCPLLVRLYIRIQYVPCIIIIYYYGVESCYLFIFQCYNLFFSAFNSTVSGALVLRQQPTDNERTTFNDGATDVPLLRDNRTAVSLGETIDPTSTPDADKLLRCVAGHQNDDTMNFIASAIVWIKDGETVEDGGNNVITISTSMAANGEVSSTLQIASFQESNAGVYQCIFTDNGSSDGEIITTIPLRLDTGQGYNLGCKLFYINHEIFFAQPLLHNKFL